jgi:hypothetical protein
LIGSSLCEMRAFPFIMFRTSPHAHLVGSCWVMYWLKKGLGHPFYCSRVTGKDPVIIIAGNCFSGSPNTN